MKVLVVGTYLDENLIERYNNLSKSDSKISVAAIKYSKFIYDGFIDNISEDTDQIFLPSIGMYPSCKVFYWSKGKISNIKYIKFINIIFFKQLSICFYLIYKISLWAFKNRGKQRVVVFTFLYIPFQFSIPFIKFLNKVKFVSFVPDLPEYGFTYTDNKKTLKSLFIPLYVKLSSWISSFSDFFVFITDHMKVFFPNKDYWVIEGFTDCDKTDITTQEIVIESNALMYSGALYEKFGIDNLLQAYQKTTDDSELWLFGSGDMVEKIIKASKHDNRIKYFGVKSNSYVRDMQKKAKILINPRFSNEEYTKYSFPSKLLEYLSSGTPVLTTRLKGIPSEYNDKFYFITDESVDGMRMAITTHINKDKRELVLFGENARKFALDNKNYKIQIKNLIKVISKKL